MAFSVGLDMAVSAGLFVAFSTEPKQDRGVVEIEDMKMLVPRDHLLRKIDGAG